MANTLSPRGFQPHERNYGPYNANTKPYLIASGYATSIFTFDLVKLVTAGVIQLAAATDVPIGIFMGVKYTDATGAFKVSPYWPASATLLNATAVQAIVIDDPQIEFIAQFNGSSIPAQADVGAMFDIALNGGGSTADGLSRSVADYSTLATTTKALRFQRFLERPDNDTTTANSWGVFAFGAHALRVNTGI
jgi:hypothetical protein